MSETVLYDNDSAIISILPHDSHVLHHVPCPDKKTSTKNFKSFECMEVQISNERKKSHSD